MEVPTPRGRAGSLFVEGPGPRAPGGAPGRGQVATHTLLSLPHCRLREHHRATIRVVRRMQYFVAKKRFQVSPALSPLLCPRSPSRPWWRV